MKGKINGIVYLYLNRALAERRLEGQLLLLDLLQDLLAQLVAHLLVLLVSEQVLRLHRLVTTHALQIHVGGQTAVPYRRERAVFHFRLLDKYN